MNIQNESNPIYFIGEHVQTFQTKQNKRVEFRIDGNVCFLQIGGRKNNFFYKNKTLLKKQMKTDLEFIYSCF